MDNPNIIQPFVGSDYRYGVTPLVIDSTRNIPYIQYALLRQGASILQPGQAGTQIPAAWSVDSTGPIFSVSFVITSGSLTNISPENFSEIFTPTLSAAPLNTEQETLRHVMYWDSDDPEFSVWPTDVPDNDKSVNFIMGKQYCVTTRPLEASKVNVLPSGLVHFSLEPSESSTYNGVKIGLMAVTYRLKKHQVVI